MDGKTRHHAKMKSENWIEFCLHFYSVHVDISANLVVVLPGESTYIMRI